MIYVLIMLYFTPSIIAVLSGKRNMLAIFALNMLLGWTVVGWLGAFIWSLCYERLV